jgi:sugar phosphate isomerase/epimerase
VTHRDLTLLDADWNHWPENAPAAVIAERAARLGLDGLELGVYDPAVQLSTERLAEWQDVLQPHGLRVGALLLSCPPDRWPDGALGAADPTMLLDAVEACAATAVDLGLTVVGLWPGADDEDADRDVVAATLARVAAIAQRYGLRVALEPKPGDLIGDPHRALELIDSAGASDHVGVLLDTGHELAAGHDLIALVAQLGDRLLHVHVGDSDGDADADLPAGRLHSLAPFLSALAGVGYAGALTPDLYGCVSDGVTGSVAAVGESYRHLRQALQP